MSRLLRYTLGVGRMDLNGQVVFCVDQLDQNGKLIERRAAGPQASGMGVDVLLQGGAVRKSARSIRVAGEHPCFGQRVQPALNAEFVPQFFAAPDVIFAAGRQFQNGHSICSFLKIDSKNRVPPRGRGWGSVR